MERGYNNINVDISIASTIYNFLYLPKTPSKLLLFQVLPYSYEAHYEGKDCVRVIRLKGWN